MRSKSTVDLATHRKPLRTELGPNAKSNKPKHRLGNGGFNWLVNTLGAKRALQILYGVQIQ